MKPFRFTVYGLPAGQGSKTPRRAKSGRMFVHEDNARVMPFRQAVAIAAVAAGARLADGQFIVSVVCTVARPPSHFLKSGKICAGVMARPDGKADGDKVLRAINDALQGIVWPNDRRVRPMAIDWRWGDVTQVDIEVGPCPRDGRWVYREDTQEPNRQVGGAT